MTTAIKSPNWCAVGRSYLCQGVSVCPSAATRLDSTGPPDEQIRLAELVDWVLVVLRPTNKKSKFDLLSTQVVSEIAELAPTVDMSGPTCRALI